MPGPRATPPGPVPPRRPEQHRGRALDGEPDVPTARTPVDDLLGRARQRLTTALGAGRLDEAEAVVGPLLAAGSGLDSLVGGLLQPAACALLPAATGAGEQRVVSTTRALVTRLRRTGAPPAPLVALVALPGERGLVCLDMLALLLEADGVACTVVEGLDVSGLDALLAGLRPELAAVVAGSREPARLAAGGRDLRRWRAELDVPVLVTGFAVRDDATAASRWGLDGAGLDVTGLAQQVRAVVAPLTAKELATLALVAEGLTNDRIARDLGISTGAVKARLDAVFVKLGATDRASAVASALRRGLLR